MSDRQTDYVLEIETAQRRLAELQAEIDRQREQNSADQDTIADLEAQVSAVYGTLAQMESEANG